MTTEKIFAVLGISGCMLGGVVGPWCSDGRYSSIHNTLSELAGQKMPNAWMMRLGFFAFGAGILAASALRWEKDRIFYAALMLFGLSMVGAAIWSHLPIEGVPGGGKQEDRVHSIFASVAGFALCTATVVRQMDWMSATMLAASVGFPLLMKLLPKVAGLAQRIMFCMSFVWLLEVFR